MVIPRGFSSPVATVLHCARSPVGLAPGLALADSDARLGDGANVEAADDVRVCAGLPAAALCAGRLAGRVDGLAVDELPHAAARSATTATLKTAARGP